MNGSVIQVSGRAQIRVNHLANGSCTVYGRADASAVGGTWAQQGSTAPGNLMSFTGLADAADSFACSREACVVFPARSMPSRTMKAPRRVVGVVSVSGMS